jgi:hypothetical protein
MAANNSLDDEHEQTLYKDCPKFIFDSVVGTKQPFPAMFKDQSHEKIVLNDVINKHAPIILDPGFFIKEFGENNVQAILVSSLIFLTIQIRRIQILLDAFCNAHISAIDQLALLICIRKLLAQEGEKIDYEVVIQNTCIVQTLKELANILFTDQQSPDIKFAAYYMRLEVSWILANLFYTKEEVCMSILTELENGHRKQSSIFEFLVRGLDGDMPLFDLTTFNISNLMSDRKPTELFLESVDLINRFQVMVSTTKLHKEVLLNIISIIELICTQDERA